MHIDTLHAVALVATLAAYDRICGAWANGLKRIALTVVLGGVIYLLGLAPLAAGLLSLGSYAWRSRPFGNLLNPSRRDFGRAVLRHLWAVACVPGIVVAAHVGDVPEAWPMAGVWMVAFAVFAALLARLHHMLAERGRDLNAIIEPARGAALGLAIITALRTL